jgi:hypothetical protein
MWQPADVRTALVYTPAMRLAFVPVLLSSLLCACAGDGDEDTGADDSSTTLPITTMDPADSSSDGGTTGSSFECDANVELALSDGVELGGQSVEAVRLEVGEDVQYTVTIVGDAGGTTQLDIVYPGLPTAGMQYPATAIMDQFGQPRVVLAPEVAADFVGGTVTYTMVGTAEGDTLALELDLEWTRGTIAGCVHTELTVETG